MRIREYTDDADSCQRIEMESNNLFYLLVQAVSEKPDKTFFYYGRNSISYREVYDRSRSFANALRKRGIACGDRILLSTGNTPAFLYTYFAALQLGVIVILVNPAARRHELRYYCEETEPKLIITESPYIDNYKVNNTFFVNPASIITTDEGVGSTDLMSLIAEEEPLTEIEDLDSTHTTAIIFTSAMDGYALGAMINHRAILETAKASSALLVREHDTFLTALPLFHSFGLTSSLFIPLFNLVPFYLVRRFSPKRILDILSTYNITVFCGVPIMFQFLSQVMSEEMRFPNMRAWISGGESISTELQKHFKNIFDIDIRQGYGLTEASPIVTWNLTGRKNKFGSIGLPMPYNEVQILNDGKFAPSGEQGEIIAKGVNVITGYYKKHEKSKEYIIDGWLHTGDIGTCDSEGYFYITNRKKNMIIKSGFNIYPKEIEKILKKHPSVQEVHVTGHIESLDDATKKEHIEALLYRKKGVHLSEEEFLNWCKENISSYKIPDSIIIR